MPGLDLAALYVQNLRYLRRLGSATAETTFYTPLANLFNAVGATLKPKVLFSSQLRNQGAGIPDGGFFPQPRTTTRNTEPILTNPERGVVEIKPAGYSLDTLTHSDQTRRYLQQYGLVLLTNLHEFRLVGLTPAGLPRSLEKYTLAKTPDDLWHRPIDPKHDDLLPDFLKRVMLYKVPLTQPKDVAWLLASYAREARSRAEDHDLPAFRNVKTALEESLGIQFEGEKGEHFFRSTLVQTLFYGIFSAWVLWRHSPEGRIPHTLFNWRLADLYLKVPILRKLFREVADPHYLNTIQLTEILELAGEALNRVEPQLFDIFQGEQAVAYFYEPFLEAFDPQLRKDLGVWYTPREIVHYMVERVDHLLRTELNQPLGLASPAVRILDPCCGTGAYLTAVLGRIHRTLLHEAGDDTALVPAALRTAAITRVFGFEIMPAPFVIAHMEIARLLEDAGAPLQDNQRAGIFLTNALTGWIPEVHPQSVLSEEFRREREDSEQIKQQGTILVILGNPPYNGYAGIAKIEEERNLTTAYRTPVAGLPAPQGQGLNDLYIRFFRIAERRIASNRDGQGIVCFISNYSWLDGLSHTTMRHHYLQSFSDIYIDNLHGDRKISEYAPDGRTSETVFAMTGTSVGIRIGTAVSTLLRKNENLSQAALHYRDFDNARASDRRLAMLNSLSESTNLYHAMESEVRLGLPLKPRTIGTSYLTWPLLPSLFSTSFPGIKTSRDLLLVDISRERLETRVKRYLNPEISDTQIGLEIPGAMEDSARFHAHQTRTQLQQKAVRRWQSDGPMTEQQRQTLLNAAYRPWQIIRFAYRPFDLRWLYWEPTTKLLDEKREDYVAEAVIPTISLIAQQKSRGASSPSQIISAYGCLDLMDRGATCFPLVIFDKASRTTPISVSKTNLSEPAASYIHSKSAPGSTLLHHVSAVIHSPLYRTEHKGALLGDWPRIPLPATAELLNRSAELGVRLASLLDPSSSTKLSAEWSFLATLRLPSQIDLEECLKVTVGWGRRGQGNTVMPGNGNSVARPWTATERDRLATLAATQSLTLEAALTLLGDTCLDIYLNGQTFWSAVPANVWTYTLGGYQVLKKWLSYREAPLLGRPLHPEESDYFAQVVRRITAILLLGPALDASYAAILPTATGLPS